MSLSGWVYEFDTPDRGHIRFRRRAFTIEGEAGWRNKNKRGRVHFASHTPEHDNGPMFICGKNSRSTRIYNGVERIAGPVVITCRQCTAFLMMSLARRKLLPGCRVEGID